MSEKWENELLAWHRWGKGTSVEGELARLRDLWEAAQPIEINIHRIIDQILEIEICLWNLEDTILTICGAIGKKESPTHPIGHGDSINEERWRQVWAYYYSLKIWLSGKKRRSFETMLKCVDPDETIFKHIMELLGPKEIGINNDLKALYVERFTLGIENWFEGFSPRETAQKKALVAAVKAIENEIIKLQTDPRILKGMQVEGGLQPCHHKAFRRYDILLHSIAKNQFRGNMPIKGSDGYERANLLNYHLNAINSWIQAQPLSEITMNLELATKIYGILGEPDKTKIFLASLLVSLLRPQQINSRKMAEISLKKAQH